MSTLRQPLDPPIPSNTPEPPPARDWWSIPRNAWLREHFTEKSNGEGLPAADLAREMSEGIGETISEAHAIAAARAMGAKVDAVHGRTMVRLSRKVAP